jgi:hypothetical protein
MVLLRLPVLLVVWWAANVGREQQPELVPIEVLLLFLLWGLVFMLGPAVAVVVVLQVVWGTKGKVDQMLGLLLMRMPVLQ